MHQIEFVGAQGERNGADLVEGVTIRRYQINQSSVSGAVSYTHLTLPTKA